MDSSSDKPSKIDLSFVKPEFSVRIVVCDHYLTRPIPGIDVIYSEFRGSDIKQVPVLRVFGPSPGGQKACLHIHGVFPYFYIPCPEANPQPQFLYQIAASLDKALNIALKQATSANQHVYKISVVKGLPFYGYHDKEHLFLKIFLYNPGLIKQAVELCCNGAVLGQAFQPHEAHLNFTLQFFIDFNLFGMSYIDVQTVKYRKTGSSQHSDEPVVSHDNFDLKAESICFYEADCVASHILNRRYVSKGDGIENPGLEEVWHQEMERRKRLNVSMASKSLSQTRLNDETNTHKKYENMILVKLSNLDDKPLEIIKKVNELIHYPAESLEGSQLLNATDVSHHIRESTINENMNDTLRKIKQDSNCNSFDDTLVNEEIALNSSYSLQMSVQYTLIHFLLLDSEDLELVDMLQDLEEKPVDEDSVMGTQVEDNTENEIDSENEEYSQAFNDETILMEVKSNKDNGDIAPSWSDSIWEDANIPQLDGTCDDEHVKKVRKRKMRPIKVGLSRPRSKRSAEPVLINDNSNSVDAAESDEINVSMETIENISNLHLRRSCKASDNSIDSSNNEQSVTDLVQKLSTNENVDSNRSSNDINIQEEFEPVAGPSNINNNILENNIEADLYSDLESSLDDNAKGIESFYDKSVFFDLSLENDPPQSQQSESILKSYDETPEKCAILDDKVPIKHEKSEFPISDAKYSDDRILIPKFRPPSKEYVMSTLDKYKIPRTVNPEPYFSNYKDVGEKVEIGQMILRLQSRLARDQKPFEQILNTTSIEEWRQLFFLQSHEMSQEYSKPEKLRLLLASNGHCVLQPVKVAPLRSHVEKWLSNEKNKLKTEEIFDNNDTEIGMTVDDLENSQALGLNELNSSASLESTNKEQSELNTSLQITMHPDGSFLCFGSADSKADINTPTVETDFLTIMLLEVHTSTRADLYPDPAIDNIMAVFITVTNNCPADHYLQKNITEIFIVDDKKNSKYLNRCVFKYNVNYAENENELLEKLVEMVKKHDPDIMCGYDIESNSWGYVLERSTALGLEMVRELSRITEKNRQKRYRQDENELEGRVIGRITFNVWRLFRHELALSSYSFENCMYAILNERVPKYSYRKLTEWWNHESRILRWIPVEYYLTKLSGTVRMLDKLDMINRTSELARLFGLQWWEVLSRGSQFRVESLMLRAARPLNLVALSPSVRQRAAMKAPECLPLIFEPESRFYKDPVIVLDFQSLYPSMMIAYNYCFSTCIGRIQNINGKEPYEFGAWRLKISQNRLQTLANHNLLNWSPIGVGFVKQSVRRGVLPSLLRRILAARQAVKKGMKLQTDEAVKKSMHSRQLGLKLIANVTYGYTAANFSGRMPCVELGDSILAKARETLERAISLVRNGRWNAKVIYGDTDSMFVLVPGGTREEAFIIGQEIADAVTADNPSPVLLKLEKVYQPCILQTKKRYVGYMYETAEQEKPVYEAKGIETVRRDGCPAGVKLLQKSLCELFESGDMSRVKRLVCGVLARMVDGSLPQQELFFTREYHGQGGYRPGAAAPPNEIAKRVLSRDGRSAPARGSRVAWLVCAGPAHVPLVRLSRAPQELLQYAALTPHVAYYAMRVLLPPLHRCLSLLGVDVFKWWQEIGWTRESQVERSDARGGIARYMSRGRCVACGGKGQRALCTTCATKTKDSAALLAVRLARAQTNKQNCDKICNSCCGHQASSECENTECPVLWRRLTASQKLHEIYEVTSNLPPAYNDLAFNF
nr:DNA polymerase zeta catalytic subunit [Danaus plexippus plexippus]